MMTAWPLRIPFGLRFFFRAAFALLIVATLALAVTVLAEEKRLSLQNYQDGFRKNLSQMVAQLRHPSGQLALLNPEANSVEKKALRPLVLPYAAIDFDDRSKVQQAVEMSGCQVRYPDGAQLCVGLGNNPWAGGFIYLAGSFVSADDLVARPLGDANFSQVHRAQVQMKMRDESMQWIAPFETAADVGSQSQTTAPMVRGRLAGFAVDSQGQVAKRPVRDFRGWLWQDGRCLEDINSAACLRRSYFSIRLPVDLWRDALHAASQTKVRPPWPPVDLDQFSLSMQMLPPGEGAPIFDSRTKGATPPFSLDELAGQLQAGEQLRIRRTALGKQPALEIAHFQAAEAQVPVAAHWLSSLIDHLPATAATAPIAFDAQATVDTALGRYELTLTGDGRSVNAGLAAVANRVSWFVLAMLLAIGLTWLALELRIIRRITLLSRRAATVSHTVRGTDDAAPLDLSDLQSRDELGVLASALADLLQRVNEDARRERIRTAQEKDQWHAVGHEIMSPLQSLKALHSAPGDPSARYLQRMQQAVQVLYGSASPSEAFEGTHLHSTNLDLNAFLIQVANNAPAAGIADVSYSAQAAPVWVKADEHALEDAVTHVLNNANRYRVKGTSIAMQLNCHESEVLLDIGNQGPNIAPDMLGKLFEYGVSDQADNAAPGSRGQGLFVARTYLAKMGGTLSVQNTTDGVRFIMAFHRQ